MSTGRRLVICHAPGGRTATRGCSLRWPRGPVLAPALTRKLLDFILWKQVDYGHKASSTHQEYFSSSPGSATVIPGSAPVIPGYERLVSIIIIFSTGEILTEVSNTDLLCKNTARHIFNTRRVDMSDASLKAVEKQILSFSRAEVGSALILQQFVSEICCRSLLQVQDGLVDLR